MPKPTLTDIAKRHGITRDQLNAARAKGVNCWNDAEMKAHLGKVRHRQKPNAKLVETIPIPPDASPEQTLEMIERRLRDSTDHSEIKILKDKLAGLKTAVAIRAETGELMPLGEVKEAMVRIMSETRGELLKLTSELPPVLAGESPASIQKKLRAEITAILKRLHDNFEKG